MSQDVDILSPVPAETARALAEWLGGEFHIAARVREVKAGIGFRVYQKRSESNRHLADVRLLDFTIDSVHVVDGIRYVPLLTLFAMKLTAWSRRRMAPKGGTDLADLRRLLLVHRDALVDARVRDAIALVDGGEEADRAWEELRDQPMVSDDDFDDGC